MALWLFPSPPIIRAKRKFEERPIFSLWTRVNLDIPSTLLRRADGVTWEEYVDTWPTTRNPRNKYFFSTAPNDGGCFNTMGSDQSSFEAPTRLYIGGHSYIISDALKAELAAATTSFGGGYDTIAVPAPPGSVYTGDEIILSGYDEVHPKGNVV